MRYEDFFLTLDPQADGFCAVAVSSPTGEGRGSFQIAVAAETPPLPEVEPVAEPGRDLRPGAKARLDPTVIGGRLFQALFQGTVRDLFERSLGLVESDPDQGLRIVLWFDPEQPGATRIALLP